jgi:hypothetical protein
MTFTMLWPFLQRLNLCLRFEHGKPSARPRIDYLHVHPWSGSWQTISQTKDGHVGSLRESFEDPDAAHRMLARTGMAIISVDEEETEEDDTGRFAEDDISPEAIHAALEKSQQNSSHGPLNLKPENPKRRNFARKKKA